MQQRLPNKVSGPFGVIVIPMDHTGLRTENPIIILGAAFMSANGDLYAPTRLLLHWRVSQLRWRAIPLRQMVLGVVVCEHAVDSCAAYTQRGGDGASGLTASVHPLRQCRFGGIQRLGATDGLTASPSSLTGR